MDQPPAAHENASREPDDGARQQSGVIPSDAVPRRGLLLLGMAMGSVITVLLASLLLNVGRNHDVVTVGLQSLPVSAVGFWLGWWTRKLAQNDLSRFSRSDRSDCGITNVAHEISSAGVLGNVLMLVAWAGICLLQFPGDPSSLR